MLDPAYDHWKFFSEFCIYEVAAGGPDPHLRTVGEMALSSPSWEERVWRGGCYAAVYNGPCAEVIWQHWSYAGVQKNPDGFTQWIIENWRGMKLRKERRAVRTPRKLVLCLLSYASWQANILPTLITMLPTDSSRAHDILWESITKNIYGMGRYIASKLAEYLYRYVGIQAIQYDIHPVDGWSPRTTLALIFPDLAESIQPKSNKPTHIRASNAATHDAMHLLSETYGLVGFDYYSLEDCLCEYKQSFDGQSQFPGRSNDSELMYYTAMSAYWGSDYQTMMWDARRKVLPDCSAGEICGWSSVREELGPVLSKYGYTWSDHLYDYTETPDLKSPVHREGMTHEAVLHIAQETLSKRSNESKQNAIFL